MAYQQTERVPTEYAHGSAKVLKLDQDLGCNLGLAKLKGNVCRRSSHGSNDGFFKISKLLVITIQLVFLSSYCSGYGSSPTFHAAAGRGQRRSLLQTAFPSNPNCTRSYTVVSGDTCASLRSSQNLSQDQILSLNPELNCKTLQVGQSVCVQGIPERCRSVITVNQGPATNTCESIATGQGLSEDGFFILNPGLSCPEGNNNSWPTSSKVCLSLGLGNIFFEYIGASGNEITFNDISPLVQAYSDVVYNVILAFAIDTDANGVLQNGTFTPYWSPSLDPLSAQAFKADNPGVRLLVSLGGATQFIGANLSADVNWQDPPNAEEWVANAEASLTAIAQNYSIDGVDIDYENFPTSSSFAYCIGTLIGRLKRNNTIGIATIAPYGPIIPQYQSLMNQYGDLIDYVNFQFYAGQVDTLESYIQEFNDVAGSFVPWKLLASTQVGGLNSITGPTFLTAIERLSQSRGLPGVMLFEADDSLSSDFAEENGVLALLNGQTYNPGPAPAPTSPAPPPESSTPPPPAPGPADSIGAPITSLPSSAPARLLESGRSWGSQFSKQPGFVVVTTSLILLFSFYAP